MKKLYYIWLYKVFGIVPKNGILKDYLKKLYSEYEEERKKRVFFIQANEINKT